MSGEKAKKGKKTKRAPKKAAEPSTEEVAKRTQAQAKNKQEAVAYLNKWKSDRSSWKFNKNMQSWLISHVFDQQMVSCEQHGVFLISANIVAS